MARFAIDRSLYPIAGVILSLIFATSCATSPEETEKASLDSPEIDAAIVHEDDHAATTEDESGETTAPADSTTPDSTNAAPAAATAASVAATTTAQDDGSSKGVADEAEERWKIKQQQLKMEAEEQYLEGQRLLDQGNYQGAILHFEQTLNHIRWAPVGVDWGNLRERATSALEAAERSKTRKDTELRRDQDRTAFETIKNQEQKASAREQAMTMRMMEDSIAAFERNDFDEARLMAHKVIERDPENDRARRLAQIAKGAARDEYNEGAVDMRKEEFRAWKLQMEETRIPYADILTGPDPDFWKEISAKRNLTKNLALSNVDSPEEADLKKKLAATRIASIQFPDMSLTEAAQGISLYSGIPIVVDEEVAEELDSSGVLLNIGTLTNITVESLLKIITSQAGEEITYSVKHGVVLITTTEKSMGEAIPRIHTVQDLTFALTDFRGPQIGHIALSDEEYDEEEGGPFGSDQLGENVVQPDEIINIIRENIARDTWDTGSFTIDTANNNQILVVHTPEIQYEVAQFLDDLRRFSSTVITIEARFVTITDAFLQEVGVDWRGLGGSAPGTLAELSAVTYGLEDNAGTAEDNSGPGLPTGAGLNPLAGAFFNDGSDGDVKVFTQNFFETAFGEILSPVGGAAMQIAFFKGDSQYNMVIRAVEKSLNATEITAPILTVYNTERAYVTVTNQVSYVQDFDVDVANSAFIANPNIGIIQEGVVLDVRPTVSYDRKYITLEVQATVADLVLPMRTFTTSLAGFSVPVSFQLPELEVSLAETTVRVPDGGSLVLGGLKHINYVNRTAEVPWLGRIPVLGILFREKQLSDEAEDLIVIVRASITSLAPWRSTAASN